MSKPESEFGYFVESFVIGAGYAALIAVPALLGIYLSSFEPFWKEIGLIVVGLLWIIYASVFAYRRTYSPSWDDSPRDWTEF
jgi:hypothetical protein